MRRFVQMRLALVGVLLAMIAGTAPPAVASEPPDINCTQTVVTDPRTGLMTFVTVITVQHDGELLATLIVRGLIDCPGGK